MTVVYILLILFAALFIVIPLIEKYGKRHTPEELSKISRFIWPLLFILLFAQLLRYMFDF